MARTGSSAAGFMKVRRRYHYSGKSAGRFYRFKLRRKWY